MTSGLLGSWLQNYYEIGNKFRHKMRCLAGYVPTCVMLISHAQYTPVTVWHYMCHLSHNTWWPGAWCCDIAILGHSTTWSQLTIITFLTGCNNGKIVFVEFCLNSTHTGWWDSMVLMTAWGRQSVREKLTITTYHCLQLEVTRAIIRSILNTGHMVTEH